MNERLRQETLAMSRAAHDLTETAYQQHLAKRGDENWNDKQRILLADMALHLLQTALKEGALSEDGLKRNLYSILTISEQFIPDHGLKACAEKLYPTPS